MDYAKLVATAQRLIASTGREITLQKYSAIPSDANKPWNGPATTTVSESVTTFAVFVPASGTGLGQYGVAKELLARVEQVALIAGSDTDLSKFNGILDSGSRWSIDWFQVLKPSTTTVLYLIGVCR